MGDYSGYYFRPEGSLSEYMGKAYGTIKDAENYLTVGEILEYAPASNEYVKKVDVACNFNGCKPNGPMTLVDGKFYGTTESGGANDSGVLFEWDP